MPLWIIVVLLGIIEGLTEFLPVSSTGHLLVTESILQKLGALGPNHWLVRASAEKDLFNIVIQCGAVLAVVPLFRNRFHQFFFQWRQAATRDYLLKIFAAFAITGAAGYVMDKKGFKLPDHLLPIAIALLVGGILFVVVESWLSGRNSNNEVTWPIVIAVGLGQLLAAAFPGTSRSGATILLALMLGLNRVAATEFAFLVGIPTMLAAGGLKIFKSLRHSSETPVENWQMVVLGFLVAAVVSFFAVKWLLRYVQTHTFIAFGWYRIAIALLIGFLLFFS